MTLTCMWVMFDTDLYVGSLVVTLTCRWVVDDSDTDLYVGGG